MLNLVELGYVQLDVQASNLFFQVISERHDQRQAPVPLPICNSGRLTRPPPTSPLCALSSTSSPLRLRPSIWGTQAIGITRVGNKGRIKNRPH